ncbi:dCMP deaminase family protein [Oceanotoga sp. DSM 15011]|jgi:dCMP deaminase|uniref:deoxycytidylate deaminase n=1 Tax=Oceanotoga TaxID=1255275 RepID=UPI0021F41DAF|nr:MULTISPECIES: dCMP deaminase family protein [Oceanotoga]MDO7977118.1 dCMP deaminase family protein [Oceanotoga teriensis]UYP00217.1 dCMP deaminase family protein [Oceanotoga sp. DSM 15011]
MELKDRVSKYLESIDFENVIKSPRESWDDYFMRVSFLVSERSSCLHRQVGAIIVKDKRILATGYNQPPSGFPHCKDIGCIRDALEIKSGEHQEVCFGLHAEQNALMQAAKFGIKTDNSIIYVTHQPCSVCARLIINAGIGKVIFKNPYPDNLTKLFFEKCNIETKIMN